MRGSAGVILICGLLAAPMAFAQTAPDAAPPAATAPALPPSTPPDDAAFDAQFQCPEALGDRDSRIEELAAYTAWTKDHHPEWSFRKRLDVRYGLLRRHACAQTLANVAASARPPFTR